MSPKWTIGVLAAAACIGLAVSGCDLMSEGPRIEEFDPSTYTGKTGKITMASGAKEFELFLRDTETNKYTIVRTSDGTATAPVGQMELADATLTREGKYGKWSASCAPPKTYMLNLTEGATKKLSCGPPFAATIKVTQSGRKANMDLVITDPSGWRVGLRPDDPEAKAPVFKVMSLSGKKLWQGSFEYG